MHLSNDVTQEHRGEIPLGKSPSPRANFQLSGVWLLLARGAWISFILFELLVVFIALMTTDRQALTICPFIVSCVYDFPSSTPSQRKLIETAEVLVGKGTWRIRGSRGANA